MNEGDLLAVPLDRDHFALAKVIFVSSYFKDLIALRLFKQVLTAPRLPSAWNSDMVGPILYTSSKGLSRGWTVVGNHQVTDVEGLMTKRIVGGGIWVKDEELGPVSDEDRKVLPKMLALGLPLAERRMRELLPATQN